jgi:hypothetical protein
MLQWVTGKVLRREVSSVLPPFLEVDASSASVSSISYYHMLIERSDCVGRSLLALYGGALEHPELPLIQVGDQITCLFDTQSRFGPFVSLTVDYADRVS